MRNKREFFENFLAEVIARLIVGACAAGFVFAYYLPSIAGGYSEPEFWFVMAVPIGAGIHYAIFGTRKGPGLM